MHYFIGWIFLLIALIAFVAGLWFVAAPAVLIGLVALLRNPETPRYGYSHFVPENHRSEALLDDAGSSDGADDCGGDAGGGDGGSCDAGSAD
jgi:hypothetical protein